MAVVPTSFLFSWSWGFLLGVKWPDSQVSHSYPSSVKDNNDWSCSSTPSICLHGVDRDYFTCFILNLWMLLPSSDRYSNNSFKCNQQDITLYNILYCCQCCTCFRRVFRPSSGAQSVHTAPGIRQACLLLPLTWVSWQCQLTHASGSS